MVNAQKPNGWAMRKASIDIGLDVLRAKLSPGEAVSQRDIAYVCGCSPQLIQQIEKAALLKVRQRLKQKLGLITGDFATSATL